MAEQHPSRGNRTPEHGGIAVCERPVPENRIFPGAGVKSDRRLDSPYPRSAYITLFISPQLQCDQRESVSKVCASQKTCDKVVSRYRSSQIFAVARQRLWPKFLGLMQFRVPKRVPNAVSLTKELITLRRHSVLICRRRAIWRLCTN
jgi:hypothetical protein